MRNCPMTASERDGEEVGDGLAAAAHKPPVLSCSGRSAGHSATTQIRWGFIAAQETWVETRKVSRTLLELPPHA